jgi:hypothetical protein
MATPPDFMQKLMQGLLGQPASAGMLDEQQQAALRNQAMMSLGSNLLANSGPSPVRQGFGSVLGQSLMGAQQQQAKSSEDMIKSMLLQSQIAKNNRTTSTQTNAQKDYEYAKANGFKGSFEEWKRVAAAQPSSPAAIQEYEYFNKLSPEQQKQFLSLQRSPVVPQIALVNGVPTLVDRTGATPPNPLSTPESEAEAARKRKEAEAAGAAGGQIEGAREAKRGPAYDAFRTGIKSLEGAMSRTATGPIAGRIPAVTAAQQTAEGAEATMAPILKQLFRDAGEGTFTDSDQALLMKMVPTRKDHDEARKAKIEMIDAIVQAKIGIAAPPASGGSNIDALLDKYAPK